jgi:hypothetical protein
MTGPTLIRKIVGMPQVRSEVGHKVGVWQTDRKIKLTSSVNGLCYVLVTRVSLDGYLMHADGDVYIGDGLRVWAEANVPESLARAAEIKASHP